MSTLSLWLRQRVADAMEASIVTVRADEPLIGAVGRLRATDASAAVVVDAEGHALGLIDAELVLRRVVFDAAPEQQVQTLLGGRPPILSADEPLYRAVVRMPAQAVVIDGSGRPCGMLRRDRALAAAMAGLLRPLARASALDDIAGLAEAKAAQADIAAALFAEHQPAMAVLAFINDLGLGLIARVCELTVAALAADGWGKAPVPFAVIVMGSAGRGESLLAPDQDNGLILADHAAAERAPSDVYYVEFARRLTRDLAAVGFPLCAGDVMATNPVWRQALPQWCAKIDGWVRSRDNVAMLHADIFFDFRPAFGAAELATELRRHVTQAVKGNGPFLGQMAWRQAEEMPSGGLLGRLLGGFAGAAAQGLDLKLHGTLPLVEGVRLLALWAGIEATGTMARLAALRDLGLVEPADHDGIAEAFTILLDLLLRRQIADAQAGRPVGTVVAAEALERQDRERLDATLRRIDAFRRHAAARLLGTAPGAGM